MSARACWPSSSAAVTPSAIARNPERVPTQPGVTPKRGDVADKAGLAALLAGHDAAISAVRFTGSDPWTLIGAVKAAGVPRYLVVGGAGSLKVAPGLKLMDAPSFPAAYRPEALGGAGQSDEGWFGCWGDSAAG